MTLRTPGESIPPGPDYPGLLSYGLGNGREIVVIGFGEEAERVLAEAVERRDGAR